jgi:hypothetical protein
MLKRSAFEQWKRKEILDLRLNNGKGNKILRLTKYDQDKGEILIPLR